MARHIFYNQRERKYTLEETDEKSREKNISKIPPKFSLEDKYSAYRREEKKKELRKRGLY